MCGAVDLRFTSCLGANDVVRAETVDVVTKTRCRLCSIGARPAAHY
jgi:hypothetical protein